MSFFSNIFKKKEPVFPPADISMLGTDVHSHLIPGIDDGAKTMEDSLNLIRGLVQLGYKKIITTPHIMSDYYRNTPEIILSGLADVREAIKKKGVNVLLEAAAEYNLDYEFENLILEKKLLTVGTDNHVLFELPFMQEPLNLTNAIFSMQTNGYKPILAHAERYSYWYGNTEKYHEMHNKGLVIQVNIGSLTGHYGPEAKKAAEYIIDNELIGMLGSDCHHLGHIELIKEAQTKPYFHKALEMNLLNKHL